MLAIYYTLRDKDIETIELTRWVRKQMPKYSTYDAIMTARSLKNGERWNPPIDDIKEWRDAGPCDYVTTPDPENIWEMRDAKYQAHHDLGKRGAEGDAQAAIEFCKLYLNGELNYLGAAFA
jgi:hypothetical protein